MTRPRHIVMPTRVLPHHSAGGMQAVAWDLATTFAHRGLEITVLTSAIPDRPDVFDDSGVHVRALGGTSWQRYGKQWWRSTRSVFEHELLQTCDLVFSISAGGFALLPLRRRIPTVPFVMQAHGTSVAEVLSKWRSGSLKAMASSVRNVAWIAKDLMTYRKFDAIAAVGDSVAADLAAWPVGRMVDSCRVKLIRNGIDTRIFRPDAGARVFTREKMGWDESQKVIVSVSRLHKQKGVDLGLEAFALLTRQAENVRYFIIGEGPELEALKSRVAQLGISKYVQFAGGMERGKIPVYLNAADTMLFTTRRTEGNPLNILEALSVGLPVVTSTHLRGIAPPSEHILFVDQNDPEEVTAALRCGLQIGSCHRSLLPPGFSMKESAEEYLNLFDELIARRH